MHSNKISMFARAGAAMAAVTVLAGCAATAATSSGARPRQTAITVDSVPAAEEAGLYVAAEQGFFRQQGLTVTIKSVTGGEAGIPDLQSGAADIVGGNYVSFILAQMAGSFARKPVSMRIIAAGSELQPGSEALYVMPGSRFSTVAELATGHARIGLNTANDVGGVLISALLEEAGYSLRDIRQVIPAGGFPTLLKMLPRDQVDAIWLPQPLGEMAEQEDGAVPLADFDAGSLQDLPFTGYIGSTSWLSSHPVAVAAFLRALEEGQQLADTDRSVAETAMEKYAGIPAIIADTMALDSYPLEMDVPQLQRVPDSMFQFGLTGGSRAPYQIMSMIAPEPGLIK